jgi:NAD(P)-dependent dehydrogenase (short-subunit alcohol dehydrogenase family)
VITGAEVALLDVDGAAVQAKAKSIGGAALGIRSDVIDAASVKGAFARVASAFGGVDIVGSNAGAAWQGRIGEVDEAVLRESFELNFYGHQRVAQAAVKIIWAARHRRLPAVQCVQTGRQSRTQCWALWPAESGDVVSRAAIRAVLTDYARNN